jgi:hypothetical protein
MRRIRLLLTGLVLALATTACTADPTGPAESCPTLGSGTC